MKKKDSKQAIETTHPSAAPIGVSLADIEVADFTVNKINLFNKRNDTSLTTKCAVGFEKNIKKDSVEYYAYFTVNISADFEYETATAIELIGHIKFKLNKEQIEHFIIKYDTDKFVLDFTNESEFFTFGNTFAINTFRGILYDRTGLFMSLINVKDMTSNKVIVDGTIVCNEEIKLQ